jgi:SAM-dependent methyltransferase
MFSGSKHNPKGRFDGLASTYARYRPDYPRQAIDWIVELLPNAASTVIDVGCGTGIAARQLAARGARVIGIEPNDSMRSEAQTTPSIGHLEYRAGAAEKTGLPTGSADAVVAAQAFHWFDREAALREFHRLLRPGGWLTLVWNSADLEDDFTAAYWAILRESSTEPEVVERPHHVTGQVLLTHPLFQSAIERSAPNAQILDEAGLLGRSLSASFAPKECSALQRFAERITELFHCHESQGKVVLAYQTTLFQAQRCDAPTAHA